MRFYKHSPILETFYSSLFKYPTPTNINYLWNFGSIAGICLVIQIITGIFLAMHYIPHADLAFISTEHIMRDVNYGWLIRYIHANGASMFFLVIYIHLFRGLYYGSYIYPRELLWCVGVIIIFIMILTAFLGYVLPWGQMSFWAATVITNLVSVIPFIGESIVLWLWGGFAVDQATLNRFFSLHYLFPFVLSALVGVHLIFLHTSKSNNPLGIKLNVDYVSLHPLFMIKDFHGFVLFFLFFSIFVFFMPNFLGHPDNYIPANPLSTPAHIVPEWYFLPFYAILRSVPSKLGGVLLLLGAIIALLVLPFLIKNNIRNSGFRPLQKIFFWIFVLDCLFLGWLGGKPIETPYLELSQISTIFYFLYFFVILPLINKIENFFWNKKYFY